MERGDEPKGTALDRYRLLGRCGLRVSPAALGTLTFGLDWGIGADKQECLRIFEGYLRRGGNFIDTSAVSNNGTSEALVGEFAEPIRQQLVIGTKFGFQSRGGDPNSGGSHRKSLIQSLEGSLRRLRTDYVDLLWVQIHDSRTPPEETLRALDDLVRSGKVLYIGVANTPAWRVSGSVVTSELRGWSSFVGIQISHCLLDRTPERELLPMAEALGLAVVVWGALGGGMLTGKYRRDTAAPGGFRVSPDSRRQHLLGDRLSDRNLGICEAVCELAKELGRSPAQIALSWTLSHSTRMFPVIGARTFAQFDENMEALSQPLPPEALARLDALSRIRLGHPHDVIAHPRINSMMTAGAWVEPR